MSVPRRRFHAILPLAAALSITLLTAAPASAQSPLSPEAFLGYPIGADYKLTTYERGMAWFDHLAEKSAGRMRMLDMGSTGMGRPHCYAVIS